MKPLQFRAYVFRDKEMKTVDELNHIHTWANRGMLGCNEEHFTIGIQGGNHNECIVMQGIGLQDVTGQDIFEGDILKHAPGYVTKVQWSEKAIAWEMIGEDGGRQDFAWYVGNYENLPMVIGNIYETPEKFTPEPDEERTDPFNL